jgi:alpha-ketoglutarate-dependent sulfate ester dioxygenase
MGRVTEIQVRPLASHVGAEIHNVNLAERVDGGTIAQIGAALLQWKVVFFRDQQIGHTEQIAFAARFGDLTYAHPHEDQPLAEFPEILPIDSRRFDQRYGKRYSYENRWHTDVTAAVNPPAASILRAHSVPEYGGDTTWSTASGCALPLRTTKTAT